MSSHPLAPSFIYSKLNYLLVYRGGCVGTTATSLAAIGLNQDANFQDLTCESLHMRLIHIPTISLNLTFFEFDAPHAHVLQPS